MIRRDFFRLVTAAAAMAVLPFKAAAKAPTWQMVLYNGDTVIAKCEGTVQSSPDTFDGEFVFKDAAVIERVLTT